MNEVERFLKQQIRLNGPMSVEQFFLIAASGHPQSYYASQVPFGPSGDFITAPEFSQVFGECLGLWCLDLWMRMGSPAAFRLVELGPGNGTLMADILRTAAIRPGFAPAAHVELVETSPRLRAIQAARLQTARVASLRWADSLEDVSDGLPLIVVCNEFFDALPARQFLKLNGRWHERVVALDKDDRLSFGVVGDTDCSALVPAAVRAAPDGSVHEACAAGASIARRIGEMLVANGGALVSIDYGYEGPAVGDTLQALRSHAPCSVLSAPGTADITFHVDFAAIAAALRGAGAHAWPVVDQGTFLLRLGAAERTAALVRRADPGQGEALRRAFERLTSREAMGTLFKVLCASHPATLVPAGVMP